MIKVSGLRFMESKYKKAAKQFAPELRKVLIRNGSRMSKHAKADHEFTPISGNAEKSITSKTEKNRISMQFGILGKITETNWRGGVSYVNFLHEGTYKGYRQSKASPNRYSPRVPKTGYGILADHFIDRAWDKYYPTMVDEMRGAIRGLF